MRFKDILRLWCTKRALTQREAARVFGYSLSHFNHLYTGADLLSVRKADAMADLMGLPADDVRRICLTDAQVADGSLGREAADRLVERSAADLREAIITADCTEVQS